MKTVYLAGPIAGLSYDDATDWRFRTIAMLRDAGIKGISPMRGKEYLSHIERFEKTADAYAALGVFSSSRGILTRDYFDATRCDVLLANLQNARNVSIGTMFEIAWAFARRTPIVCVMENGNAHEHVMLSEMIGFRVETLDEGIDVVKAILV